MKITMGIRTVETIQHKSRATVLLMLLHALVLSHFKYSALFLLQLTSPFLLSLEKFENWASNSVCFRSSIKGSFHLRIEKNVLGIRKYIKLKSLI